MAKIYLIYNTLNNKKYVGQTTNCVSQRFCQHIDAAFRKKVKNIFYEEISNSKENVFEVFKYKILCECSNEEKDLKEIEYIKKIKPEYNENFKHYYLLNISNKIIEEYNSGKTITQIRNKYKCRHSFISNLLKSNGITIQKSRSHKSKKVYLFDKKGNVIKCWQNVSLCEKELGITKGNVRLCCIKNTKENMLYYSANGYNFKYDDKTPKDMFEIINKKTNETVRFKTKQDFTYFFIDLFPNKKILYSQLVRNRKSVYGFIVKKLYEDKKLGGDEK